MKTSLSAGLFIPALVRKAGIKAPVYPVIAPLEASLPYIVYARKMLDTSPAKGESPADTVTVSVWCNHSSYEESVELAEAVRGAVERKSGSMGDLTLRSSRLTDGSEVYADNAYTQYLEFSLKIN